MNKFESAIETERNLAKPAVTDRWPAWAYPLIGTLLLLSALAGAWRQAPRPLPPPAVQLTPAHIDWWRYPLESNPALRLPAIQGNLRGVHALEEGKLWVVGEGGLILHTPDGGSDWRQQHPKPTPAPEETVGAVGMGLDLGVITSAHAIDLWQQSSPPPEQKTAPATKLDKTRIEPLKQPAASKPEQKRVIKPVVENEKPITGKTEESPPPDDVDLNSVFFQDAKLGWAAGERGKIWRTGDGGNTWQAGFVGEAVRLTQIFADNGFVLAISAQGRVFGSADAGQNWQPFEQLRASPEVIAAMLRRASTKAQQLDSGIFATPAGYWQPGPNGALRHAPDAPENWQGRSSGTQATLVGIAFADAYRGWAVGDAGVILHSDDGGQSWHPQSGGAAELAARSEGAENRLMPAPWTWLAALLGAGLLSLGVRHLKLSGTASEAQAETAGIAGLFVSDQPLKPGDADHLGHARLARGLADFIRNRNTEPGLTLAVTGSWGSGKSSIMRLLEDDLKRAGFRPAWFNAWHHQQEGRQLASMFNAIRQRAVPAIHTPAAWRVRAALYWHRGWFYRLLALGVLGLFLLGFLEAHDQKAPLTQLRQAVLGALIDTRPVVITSASLDKLNKGGVLQAKTQAILAGKMVWQPRPEAGEGCLEQPAEASAACRFNSLDQLYASLNHELQPVVLTDEEKQALAEAAQHLGDTPRGMLGVLIGALIIPLLLGKGLAVYGFNYLDLFKRLLPARGQVEGKEAVGTMENFRNQFCNLTQALDGRLVLFIDDLDRCDCATVREVLELVNYLVSVGQCFIVLGMAMEHVACCIEPKCKTQLSDGYAMQYLKKLINIEVPVPKADLDGIRAMLESQSKSSERPPDSEQARRWAAWIASLLMLAALTWGMHATWSAWQPDATPKTFLATPAETGRLGGTAVTPKRVETEVAESRQQPVGLMPAIAPETSLWNTLLSLLALAALIAGATWVKRDAWLDWLHRHGILQAIRIQLGGAERKRDTPAFRAALESWHAVIVAGDPTPRGIKRFVNRVRFLAMMELALESDQIPEGVLVGLAALHHAKVDYSEDFSTATFQAEWNETADTSRRDLQPAIQSALQNTPDWPPTPLHIQRFMHMVEFMHVR